MIRDNDSLTATYPSEPEAHALVAVAAGLANGINSLVPPCTAGVVAGIGSEWQLLAERGSIDVASRWRASLADHVRASDRAIEAAGYLVAPFSAVGFHALLVLVAEPRAGLPGRVRAVVQPLLDDGGVLLDCALAAQERDRVIRRVVLRCRERNGPRLHTMGDLEKAVSSLWPKATARFYDRASVGDAPWTTRRLVRAACDGNQPAVARTPTRDGLLPPELTYHVAIPMRRQRGALLVTSYAAGEEPDTDSVATAIDLARSLESIQLCARPFAPALMGAVNHV